MPLAARLIACAFIAALLGACSAQSVYEGVRQGNARRQSEPGRDLGPDPAAPPYDAYDKERQRVLKESRP